MLRSWNRAIWVSPAATGAAAPAVKVSRAPNANAIFRINPRNGRLKADLIYQRPSNGQAATGVPNAHSPRFSGRFRVAGTGMTVSRRTILVNGAALLAAPQALAKAPSARTLHQKLICLDTHL